MKINIAIDGPSAAGKSTISDLLAAKYNYIHLDTGAMYRLVAYKAIKQAIALNDEEKIIKLINDSIIDMLPDGSMYLDKKLITNEIRNPEVAMAASDVSKLYGVRKALVDIQQKIVEKKGYIVDGRDVGSVILKNAEVKFYLTASAKDRAKRRLLQNNLPLSDLDMIIEQIEKRDYQDTHRKNSPLVICDDAIYIDSSDLSIEETVDLMSKYIDKKISSK